MSGPERPQLSGIRLLVFGGRAYWNCRFLEKTLDDFHARFPISVLIHGDAGDLDENGRLVGADKLAGRWARSRGVAELPFPADWSRGRRGGPERNLRMLREGRPAAAIGFAGGRGSADMASKCREAGIEPIQPQEPPTLVRVMGPGFTAGLVFENDVCTNAAPYLQKALRARGKAAALLSAEIKAKGWKASIVQCL